MSSALRLLKRYTNKQTKKNGRSNRNAFRALRDFFGQHNRPNVYKIGRIARKSQQTGSVGNVKTPVHARPVRSGENISVVRDSVAEESSTSTCRRAQQLNISRTSLMRILNNNLNSHAYKVQLTQKLKPTDHFKRRKYAEWLV